MNQEEDLSLSQSEQAEHMRRREAPKLGRFWCDELGSTCGPEWLSVTSVFPLRSGYSYKVAVALSLFLGWLGADRFYLGYPALGTSPHTHTHTHTHRSDLCS
ncbi:hypothetical protein ATANTOWER_002204 [Ataeniobius toweri]|uniref:TM2 domain-containing protein n=1 Tax=Ataeniobius toweri TaxID=208326 RepID=A0ABU7AVG7_9TELE|nr:hypothetical protein [Ataeniobius toweri]